MAGGGKTGTTTQQVTIPPSVLQHYNYAWKMAKNAAKQPFEEYGGEFVAPINERQIAAMQGIDASRGIAQPYYQRAGEMALGAAGPVQMGELGQAQIEKYLNPYTKNVVEATQRAQAQANQQQYNQLYGNAITQGAFGGERAGIGAANLAYQQDLANQQQIAELYRQGYGQALSTASEQQLRDLQARQQDQARMLAASQQYAGYGAGAQEAALQGAQAQLGAGTLEQQTRQALDAAQYQQFLQKKGYPFQVAQFLSNIALGLGTASGSTTTTQQPYSFFSDERMKEDIKPVGKTFDGQNIYSYKYRGEPGTRMGLIAQEVEERHPEAVGEAGGMKTVDYDAATHHAAERGHFYRGGLVSEGGAVHREHAGLGFAYGGTPISGDLAAILESHRAMYPSLAGAGGVPGEGSPYGGASGPYGASLGQLARYEVMRPGDLPQQEESGLSKAIGMGANIAGIYKGFRGDGKTGDGEPQPTGDQVKTPGQATTTTQQPAAAMTGQPTTEAQAAAPATAPSQSFGDRFGEDLSAGWQKAKNLGSQALTALGFADGGLVGYANGGRAGYAVGGVLPYSTADSYVPQSVLENKPQQQEVQKPASAPGQGTSDFQNLLGTAGSIAGIYAAFSDRRMKEDIRPVGKTFDGQTVYSYRYKGEPGVQMGLIAQEVERHHPDAVAHDHRGMKMVNYDRATSDAAERGRFYAGGLARHGYEDGGVPTSEDPLDAALQAQIDADRKRGLAPFEMPRPGAPASGSGVQNRIPQSELPDFARPTGGLLNQQLANPAEIRSSLGDIGRVQAEGMRVRAQGAEEANRRVAEAVTPHPESLLSRGAGYIKEASPASAGLIGAALRGPIDVVRSLGQEPGQAERTRAEAWDRLMGAGKKVYETAIVPPAQAVAGSPAGQYVQESFATAPPAVGEPPAAAPAEQPAATGVVPPTTAAAPAAAPAGLGARPTAAAAPTVNATGFDMPSYNRMTAQRESTNDPLAQSKTSTAAGLYGITQDTWNGVRQKYPNANILPFEQGRYNPDQQEIVQRLLTQDNAKLLQNAGITPTNATLASAHRYGFDVASQINTLPPETSIEAVVARMPEAIRNQVRADFASEGVRTVGDALIRQNQGWLKTPGKPGPRPENLPAAVAPTPSTMPPEVAQAVGNVLKDARQAETPQPVPESMKRGTWFERNEDWLVPLLSGLGTMASSNSRFLGSAILQGIGGAAEAYPQVQQKLAELQGTRIENQQKFLDLAQSDIKVYADGTRMVTLANGQNVPYAEWYRMGRPPTAHQGAFMESLGTPPEVLANLGSARPVEISGGEPLPPNVRQQISSDIAMNVGQSGQQLDAIAERNNAVVARAADSAAAGANAMREARKMADVLLGSSPTEVGSSPIIAFRNAAVNNLVALGNAMGFHDPEFDRGVINAQVLNKLRSSQAFQSSSSAQQNSVEGLATALAATPGEKMDLPASYEVLAMQLVNGKRLLDEERFNRSVQAEAVNQTGDKRAVDMTNAQRLFREAHPDNEYVVAQKTLKALFDASINNPEAQRQISLMMQGAFDPKELDAAFAKRGLPPMSAYLMGGQ